MRVSYIETLLMACAVRMICLRGFYKQRTLTGRGVSIETQLFD